MKIKDLPQPIKELALKRQVEQGNEPNENIDLNQWKNQGNFSWDKTEEGWEFWNDIYMCNFKPFYDLYPQDVDTSTENVDTSKDEFAIGFAEWKDENCIYYDGWNINVPLGNKYNNVYTNKELLEIYKKEQGL